ncbi:protein EMBRYONIC FLOWER 1 isoform X1 [Ricinus communis]|uniref:protein EMBRYONIC FLOWER 1 isoform X1 n=1 Tax=Ricinus communis TaxID=3988 RepID=UPI000772982B|nr:protein EMBRYONIC FLOWER 1 isoform X1 [Ricinus communis]|eukprot:XP_015573135.1 protein EMBRYONIC FLOWER 1 isoform X1 [Ricinus communis]
MKKNVVVEENQQCTNSKLVSKSMESSIKIDSISIDLINANEKSDAENCDHFSIRGYVSEIRKKDLKKCWPFVSESDCDSNKYDELACRLPSLHIPKFRYWRCQKCLWEIDTKGVGNDYGPMLKSYVSGFKPNGICCHASTFDDVTMLVSDFQQAQRLDIIKEKKVDGDASANLDNTTGDYSLPYFGKGDKTSVVAHGLTGEKNVESGDNMNQEMLKLATGISILSQKTYQTDDIEDPNLKSNGSSDLCKPGRGHHDVADAELARNLVKSDAKNHETGKVVPVVDPQKELTPSGMSGEAGNIEEACSAGKGSGHPSLELDECSSESAEIMVVNNVQYQDNSSGLHHRKTRKVRLLTELLCENADGDTENIRNDDSLSNAIHGASAEDDKLPVRQGQVAMQGHLRRLLGQQRKRKSDQDEDWRPTQTGSPNKVCKEGRVLKREAESADAIAKAFARMQLQTGRKNHCIKRSIDRSLSVGKKKNKRTLNFDESSSLVPAEENVPNETGNETGDASNSNVADGLLFKAMHDEIKGGEADIFPLSAQRMDRKHTFRKKSKTPQVYDQQASLIPRNHGMLREDIMSRKDVEFLHTRPVRVPFHTAHDATSENGRNLSLNSYLTVQRYDMQRNPQLEDGRACLLTWKEGTAGDDLVSRKSAESKYLGNFNFGSKSASDMTFGKGAYSDISGKRISIGMPLLNEEQNYASQVETGGCSHMQQKNFCSTSGKKKAIGILECSAVTRKDGDQRANKVVEQVISDDIPMEIVELMAKHQYERCLPDAEYDRCKLEVTNNTKSTRSMDFDRAYGNGDMSLFQQETAHKRNSHVKNGRNRIVKTGENLGPAKQKSVDYFSQSDLNQFNMSQLKHIPTASRFGAFFQHQEKPSYGIQHSASSSGRQNTAQDCKWIGDLVGKRSSHSCLQTSGTCNTCQGIPQKSKETNHLWSSVMPNHMPFVYSISQNCSTLPTSMDVLSNSPSSMNKENVNGHREFKFLNQSAANFGKQNRAFGSDVLKTCADPFACKHNGIDLTQKPMGSFDLYSNETIPAMHLLSLMDAGLQSGAPINLDMTPKFFKRPSATHDQDPKEFSRLDSGAYKVTNTMKHTPYECHGKNQAAEDSHGRLSTIPVVVGPSASSFSHDTCFKKATDFTCQVSQEKVKGKGSDSRTQNSGYRSQKSVSPSGNFGTNCGSIPVHRMQTMFFGASDSRMFPLQFRGLETSTKHKFKVPSGTRPVHSHKSSSDGICSVNRNPADFSTPGPGNLYMISGEDLKVGELVPLMNGSVSTRLFGQKRQKKLPTTKEHRQHPIS